MPGDDNYGQRERLLLHQHPIKHFDTSTTTTTTTTLPTSGIISTNTGVQIKSNNNNSSMVTNCTNSGNSPDSYHRKLQQQQSDTAASTASAIDINEERYKQLSCGKIDNTINDKNTTNQSSDYANRFKNNKYEKHEEKQQQYIDQPRSIPSYCERLEMAQNQDKFNHSSFTNSDNLGLAQFTKQQQQQQQQSVLQNTPVMGYTEQRLSFTTNDSYQSKSKVTNEYANSDILTLSASIKPFSSDSFPSPPSPAPTNDRFVPPPPLSPTPSEKHSTNRNLSRYPSDDCVLPSVGSPLNRDRYANTDSTTSSSVLKNRFSSAERLLANSTINSVQNIHDNHEHQQHRYCSSNERLLDPGSPALINHQQQITNKDNDRYTISTERLISSSPIHAPVPERFTNKTTTDILFTTNNSPKHERYQRQDTTINYQDRYSLITNSDKYLSNSQINNDNTNLRYSSTERILGTSSSSSSSQSRRYSSTAERDNDNQKLNDRIDRCTTSSPLDNDFLCRYTDIKDSTTTTTTNNQSRYQNEQQFNDISHHRYTQSSRQTNERYNNEHSYFTNTSSPQTNRETIKYSDASSTERLFISSSPPSLEHNRYHSTNVTASPGTLTSNEQRYHQQSPTQDNTTHHNYQSNKNDKFIQATKSNSTNYERFQMKNQDQYDRSSSGQDRIYGFERYSNVSSSSNGGGGGGGNNRYQTNEQQQQQRMYGTSERYSPARNIGDKYLSLPKPKDTVQSSRLTSSSSSSSSPINNSINDTRSYSNISSLGGTNTYVPPNAHTPVERYVPQPPPPEVFYSDRYNERYLPPVAHTPTERYVPVTNQDPGDPYMRRDLGFHNHYRLPPPPTYAFHQSHYRFRNYPYNTTGTTTTTTTGTRIGGSPGSSSSSSSTSVQREFSTSPLLRPKVRSSAIDYTNNNPRSNHSCCTEINNGQRCCCSVRRSLPPGALPSIPSNQSAQSSW